MCVCVSVFVLFVYLCGRNLKKITLNVSVQGKSLACENLLLQKPDSESMKAQCSSESDMRVMHDILSILSHKQRQLWSLLKTP